MSMRTPLYSTSEQEDEQMIAWEGAGGGSGGDRGSNGSRGGSDGTTFSGGLADWTDSLSSAVGEGLSWVKGYGYLPELPWRPKRAWCLFRGLAYIFSSEWVFLAAIGAVTALLTFGMDYCLDGMNDVRQLAVRSVPPAGGYFIWVTIMAVLGCLAVWTTSILSSSAIGSGIPEMKTVLRNMDYNTDRGYLSFRTLLSKVTGLLLAKGSGLPIGKEGPSVHIASSVANLLTRYVGLFKHFAETKSRRMEMLAAACAVGVASNFGAPIGGVLFSIEVTATGYFAVRNYWRGFFAAVAGAFIFRLLAAVVEGQNITTLFVTSFDDYPYTVFELLAFVALGLVCGILGALFVYVHSRTAAFGRSFISCSKITTRMFDNNKYSTTLAVCLILGTLSFPGLVGEWMGVDHKTAILSLFSANPLKCQGDADPSGPWAHAESIFVALPVYIILQFFMIAIAINLPIPAGVFTPVFMLGAAFGRLVGEAMNVWFPRGLPDALDTVVAHVCRWDPAASQMNYWFPVAATDAHVAAGGGPAVDVTMWTCDWNATLDRCNEGVPSSVACQPMPFVVAGGYAVVGAAALAGSVTHTISTSIIVFELTGQIQHILPVMLAVLAANAVAQKLAPSIYDSIIQLK
eukprot:UC1_evm1s2189